MTILADLQRRVAAAERAARPNPPPIADAAPIGVEGSGGGDVARRRNAVSRFEGERDRALADPSTSPLKRARLTFEGAGISAQALAILSGISRQTINKAERDPSSVSKSTLRRLAATLHVAPGDIAPQ